MTQHLNFSKILDHLEIVKKTYLDLNCAYDLYNNVIFYY